MSGLGRRDSPLCSDLVHGCILLRELSVVGGGLLLSHPLTSTSRKLPQLGHVAVVLPPGGRPCALQVARACRTRGPGLQRGPRLAGTPPGTALLGARIAVDGEWVPFHECMHHQRAAFGRVLLPRMPRLVQISLLHLPPPGRSPQAGGPPRGQSPMLGQEQGPRSPRPGELPSP